MFTGEQEWRQQKSTPKKGNRINKTITKHIARHSSGKTEAHQQVVAFVQVTAARTYIYIYIEENKSECAIHQANIII